MAILNVSNLKNYVGIAIKFFNIKYNLIKRMFDLIFVLQK
jgi:hypothetical protein